MEELLRAIQADDADSVRRLIEANAALLDAALDDIGRTPLHCAAHFGSYHTASALLKAGADLYRRDASGQLSFNFPPGDRKNMARWLLRVTHEDMQLVLNHFSYEADKVREAIEYNKARARARRLEDGRTALMIACEAKRADVAGFLLEAGAPPGDADWIEGYDAVYVCAFRGAADCLKLLLSREPALRDRTWRIWYEDTPVVMTALHLAAIHGHDAVVEVLLRAGALPDTRTEGNGRVLTPMHLAAAEGHTGIVRRLLKAGADVCAIDGWNGFNPLQFAMKAGHQPVIEHLQQWSAAKKVVLLRPLYADSAESGMPFPLYRAPLESLTGGVTLAAKGTCARCGRNFPRLFRSYLHLELVGMCQACESPIGFREPGKVADCPMCSESNSWPAAWPVENIETIAVCYECLRAGRAVISHETELGNVDLAHALQGLVRWGEADASKRHGLETTVLETYEDGSTSIGVYVPKLILFELLRTPAHQALQREYWPFHCGNFMAFLGNWEQDDFERKAPGRGREWFGQHIGERSDPDMWEDLWDWLSTGIGWSYVYQCQTCGKHEVYVDSD